MKKLSRIYEKIKPEEARIAIEKKGGKNNLPVFILEKSITIPAHSRRNVEFEVKTASADTCYY